MGINPKTLHIHKSLGVGEIHWPKIEDLLRDRFRLDAAEASDAVGGFLRKIRRPFNLSLFIKRPLSQLDNTVAAAICESHGTDSVTVLVQRTLGLFGRGPQLTQQITFWPEFNRTRMETQGGEREAMARLTYGRFSFEFIRPREVIILHALLALASIIGYVVLMGMVLYSIAVFVMFLKHPLGITIVALNNVSIGLALLCFLVAMSALFGRAIARLFQFLRR